MAAAALAAARDTASRRIETYGRPQGRTRAVPFAELSLSNSGSGDARPDLTRRVLGSDLNKVSSAGEWVGRKRRYAGRSAGAATPSVPG